VRKCRWSVRFGLGVLAAATVVGCARERDPINKVQANALAKKFFVGEMLNNGADDPEFYASTTVIDVPYGVQASIFTGATGDLRRVKWEITEKVLNARLTYESIEGVDGKGARTTNSGQVVASFAIDSHFDIRRDYNPQTGEELNVVTENTSDRPWYTREFMRVDWSSNKVESAYSFDPLSTLKLAGQEVEPITYRVDDPSDPDAPVLDAEGGYFDVTNKVYIKPSLVFGQPACYFPGSLVVGGTYPFGGCDSSEVKLRLSFLRVAQPGEPGDRDFEPQEWDGARFNAHGAFTHDRLGYDRHFGVIDSKWHHLIQRYNIWQKSHADVPCARQGGDAHTDADRDGTEDECASVGAGSRCDDIVGACTIPLARREIRTNAWHFNLSATDEVAFDSTQRAAEEWDTALRLAVQAGRRVECERTAGASLAGTRWEGQSCPSAFPIDQRDDAEVESVRALQACRRANSVADACPVDVNTVAALPNTIVLCHNPVQKTDHAACGGEALVTRPGDLRYHQVNVVPTPQTSSPWGYGPTSADPLTGEVIQASINVWNTVTDQAAQTLVDQVRWINGEIAPDKVTTGDYVQDWARAASAHVPGASSLMTPEAIDERIFGHAVGAPAPDVNRGALARQKLDVTKLNRDIAARSSVAMGQTGNGLPTTPSGARAEADARLAMAKGTPIEAALVTAPWLQMAGIPQGKIDNDVLERASPLRGLDADNMAKVEQKVNAAFAAKGQCMMMAPEPTGVVPLAKIMAKKFPYDANASAGDQASRLDRMWNFVRGKLNYAVIAHEMGHTVGLRHNFASSFDSFNYRPQYWQLRTRGGQVTTPCTGPVADGAACVGPRYFDPLDKDEVDQMIWMWSQTSVMDYAGDPTQDTIGLGVYDYSAARAFYADVVDVRNDGVKVPRAAPSTAKEAVGAQMFDLVDTVVRPLAHAFVSDTNNEPLHYSQWNTFFHLINNCEHVDTPEPAGWNRERDGEFDPVFDGHVVRSERCERMPVDYVDWRDMVSDTSVDPRVNYDPRFVVSRRAVDNQGRPRMPYAFGTDDAVEAGIPSTYQHDNGADVYEEIAFHDGLYEDRHIFDNFRRGRVNFSIAGAYNRAVSRYHNKIAGIAQQYSFIHDFILRDAAANQGAPYNDLVAAYEGHGGFLRDFAVASALAFDHFARVLTRPQPGPHSLVGSDPVLRPVDGAEIGTSFPRDVDIPQGSTAIAGDVSFGGRPIQNSVVSSSGYWNVNQAGSYYEKTHAIFSLLAQGMGSGNWSRLEGVDSRWLSSNIGNTYPNGVRQLLGALLTEDQELYAPRVAARGSGLPDVIVDGVRNTKFPRGPLGWISFASPSGPAVCWPANGIQVCTDGQGMAVGDVAAAPTSSLAVDPELGFEIQKFVLFYAYVFLPGNQRNDWVDMLRISRLGSDSSPSYAPSEMIEWKDPQTGYRYLAKRFGDEQLIGKKYDKGMGAKMLQWANHLASKAYAPNDPAAPIDLETGRFVYRTDDHGQPVVLADAETRVAPADPAHVTCEENHYCVQLRNYRGLLDYSRDTAARLGFPDPWLNGIY
jgi:hypothetical protein